MNDGISFLCFGVSVLFLLLVVGLLQSSSFRLRTCGVCYGILGLLLVSIYALSEERASPSSTTLPSPDIESDHQQSQYPLNPFFVDSRFDQISTLLDPNA